MSPVGTAGAFEREAGAGRIGFFREFWDFLKHNKKWWLLPILVCLFVLGLLIVLGGPGLAPFLYTIF
jgi:hypothetical protein